MNNWLEWRRQGIGSSDAPVIMQVSPWKTRHQLWQEKMYGDSVQQDNPSMKRGRDLEETARQEFEKTIGTLVAPANIEHPKFNWMRASLDGIDVTGKILVEIKCPSQQDHFVAVNKKVPEKYWPQLQHQMEVVGASEMFYFSFNGKEGAIVEIKRDQNYIDSLVEKEEAFWNMVQSQTPPDLTEMDYICMEGNKEWESLASELKLIKEQTKALEGRDKEVLRQLQSLTQGRNGKGHGMIMQRQICKGAVEYASIPQLQGVDVEPYRKKSFEKWPIKFIN